jgi:hypothetical protein
MGSSYFSPRAASAATLLLAVFLVTACGSGNGLHGKYYWRYQKEAGFVSFGPDSITYEFVPGNKVRQTQWRSGIQEPTMELEYELSGKEIKLKAAGVTVVGRITDDGCLDLGEKKLYCKDEKK